MLHENMIMNVYMIGRYLLGGIFFIFGLNGFFTIISVPEFHPFMQIMVESGYIYLIKTIEITGGFLLLINRWVPLSLSILAADIVNITFYHLLLDSRNGFMAIILIFLWTILFWGYRNYFNELFTKIAKPD